MMAGRPRSNFSSGGLPNSSRDRFISASAALAEETDEWPAPSLVQRELTSWRDRTSARREAKRLPSKYGRFDGERVELSVSAFHRVAPAGDALPAFWTAFREARREYMKKQGPKPASLTLSTLADRAQLSESQAKQAMMLLVSEGLVEEDDADSWVVTSKIRHYISVSDLLQYMRHRGRFERRRQWCGALLKPVTLVRRAFARERSAFRSVCLAAAGILLATLVLWAGAKLLPSGGDGGSSGAAPVGHNGAGPPGKP